MKKTLMLAMLALSLLFPTMRAAAQDNDLTRDILVTFDNHGARLHSTSASAPYRNRKRYSIAAAARRNANEVRDDYSLQEVDHWPIRSLAIYCFVYRVAPGVDRDTVVERLQQDERIDSAQPLQEFRTNTGLNDSYDDTYANLQRGLAILDIGAAHRISRGQGVRVAIIDSRADYHHEDLEGRVDKVEVFTDKNSTTDASHGTAVASVIGANANNAKGIVGVAPESRLELFVACWAENGSEKALCDSFTLAKAIDAVLGNPPQVLNMSLNGPFDPLLARLLNAVRDAGVIIVAARAEEWSGYGDFPASLESVIGVGISETRRTGPAATSDSLHEIYAPGEQIMVAVPNNAYDFRSGSSLAAAHVSGAIALLLAVSPGLSFNSIEAFLEQSQNVEAPGGYSINACIALQLADPSRACLAVTDNTT